MDSNRDDAQRCLDVAANALADGDLDKAARLLDKSCRMYPGLSDSQQRLSAAIGLARASTSSKSSSSSASASRNRSSEQNGSEEPALDTKKVTPQMKSAVQRVTKLKAKSHYEVLGLERDANDAAIKKAYRKLALQLHPDRNFDTGSDEAFKRVNAAFVILSDSAKRNHYDQFGTDPDTPAGQPSASQFQNGASVFTNGVNLEELFRATGSGQGVAADDLFEALFNGAGGGTTFQFSSNGMRFRTNRQPRRRPRRANRPTAGDVDGEDEDEAERREHGTYDDDGLTGIFQRMKPFLYLMFFMFLSYFLSDDSGASYGANKHSFSLYRSTYHSFPRHTENGIPYFTRSSTSLNERTERKLWYSVDRQALSQFYSACEQEKQQEQELRYRSRSWFSGQKARDEYKRQLDQYRKPHCMEYVRLAQSIQRSHKRR